LRIVVCKILICEDLFQGGSSIPPTHQQVSEDVDLNLEFQDQTTVQRTLHERMGEEGEIMTTTEKVTKTTKLSIYLKASALRLIIALSTLAGCLVCPWNPIGTVAARCA
jgi:hypothetical protein